MAKEVVVPVVIEGKILLVRGHKVIVDFHLAELYGVETKALKHAVKRNRERFPSDFCFELSPDECKNLRYQFGRGVHLNAPTTNFHTMRKRGIHETEGHRSD
jgi:hypothetical protein